MRILIDATPLLLRSAGVKTYTYHWIQHLCQHSRNEQILTFPALDRLPDLNHERSVLSDAETYARLGLLFLANIPALPILPWMTRKADVFHVSNMIRNPPKRIKLTATIYDMTCRIMPELHTAGNLKADESFTQNVLLKTAGLIAISENTRQDAARLLNISPDRMQVIYPGIPEVYFGAQARPSERPYVLSLGTIEPRKNIDTLLDAWSGMALRHDFDLVVVGASGWSSENTIARLRSHPEGRPLPRLCSGERVAGANGRRDGAGLSIVVRGFRISSGTGDGGGRTSDHFEHILSPGDRGRRSAVCGSPQPGRNPVCVGTAAQLASIAAAASDRRHGQGAALSLGRVRAAEPGIFSTAGLA